MSRATETGPVGISFPLGDDWFDLSVGDALDPAQLEAEVDARIEREPDLAESRQELIEMLTLVNRDANARGAVGGALYWRRHELDVVLVATLYTVLAARPDGPVEAEIDRLRPHLTQRYPADRGDPSVEVRSLPGGPALRAQTISATGSSPADEQAATAVLLATVQYWIPVPGRQITVLVTFATPSLTAAEALVAQVDRMVDRLNVHV